MKTTSMRRVLVSDPNYVLFDVYQYWEVDHDERTDVKYRINVESEVAVTLSDGRVISYDDDGFWTVAPYGRLVPASWRDFFKYDLKKFGFFETLWRVLINNRNPDFAP